MKTLLKLFIVSLVWAFTYAAFSRVLPPPEAAAVAGLFSIVELFGVFSGGRHGQSLRLAVQMGGVLIAWPLAAIALDFIAKTYGYPIDRATVIALAAAVAAGVGVFAGGRGQGKETGRLWSGIITAAIPLYAIVLALTSSPLDAPAIAAACFAVAVACLTTSQTGVWTSKHTFILRVSAAASAAASLIWLATLFIN